MEKKFKILLGGIAVFIVIAIIGVGVFLTTHSKDVNLGVNTSMTGNYNQQAINKTTNNNNQANIVDKHQAEKSNSTKSDTTSDKNDKTRNTNTSTNKDVNNSLSPSKVLNDPASTAKNQYEKIFYSSTFGRQVYPQILNDNSNNIIKYYCYFSFVIFKFSLIQLHVLHLLGIALLLLLYPLPFLLVYLLLHLIFLLHPC